MRILITNDDGIQAPGLKVLEDIARQLSDDVWIVAPETQQSAASHSITLHRPLHLTQLDEKKYFVTGTPTDCVILALCHLLKDDNRPDLVLSGVNHGENIADDVIYSGTVAAAMEAAVLGIKGIALSQSMDNAHKPSWESSAAHGVQAVRHCLDCDWPPHTLMNINFPPCDAGSVTGMEVVRQGWRTANEDLDMRTDPRGRTYFWLGPPRPPEKDKILPNTDVAALATNRVTITPLHPDLTLGAMVEPLKRAFETKKEAS